VFGLDAAHRILEPKGKGRNEAFVNILSMLRQRRAQRRIRDPWSFDFPLQGSV